MRILLDDSKIVEAVQNMYSTVLRTDAKVFVCVPMGTPFLVRTVLYPVRLRVADTTTSLDTLPERTFHLMKREQFVFLEIEKWFHVPEHERMNHHQGIERFLFIENHLRHFCCTTAPLVY